MNNTFIQRVSDLQFVLYHVEGVIGKVDLLNALDDLLLRLWVNGLLPQLPQLLLKEGETDQETDRQQQRERKKKDVLEVSTLESYRHTGTEKEEYCIISRVMKTTNKTPNINVKHIKTEVKREKI